MRKLITCSILMLVAIGSLSLVSCSKDDEPSTPKITAEIKFSAMTDGTLDEFYHPIVNYTIKTDEGTKTGTADIKASTVDLSDISTPCTITFNVSYEKQAGKEVDPSAHYDYTCTLSYQLMTYSDQTLKKSAGENFTYQHPDIIGANVADDFIDEPGHTISVTSGGYINEN